MIRGLGVGYMTLAESIPNNLKRTDYIIVDGPEVCKVGMDIAEVVTYLSTLPL